MVLWLEEGRYDISVLVKGYESDNMNYYRRRIELSSTPLHMEQDNTSIEKIQPLKDQTKLILPAGKVHLLPTGTSILEASSPKPIKSKSCTL